MNDTASASDSESQGVNSLDYPASVCVCAGVAHVTGCLYACYAKIRSHNHTSDFHVLNHWLMGTCSVHRLHVFFLWAACCSLSVFGDVFGGLDSENESKHIKSSWWSYMSWRKDSTPEHEDLGLVFLYFPQWHVAPRRFAMKTCVEKRTKHPERDAAIPLRRPQTPLPRLRKTPTSPSAGQSSERSSSTPAGPAEGWLGWDF